MKHHKDIIEFIFDKKLHLHFSVSYTDWDGERTLLKKMKEEHIEEITSDASIEEIHLEFPEGYVTLT